ncbi:MAG: DUF1902 domain-containing protein [Acetobacteraceae bacterium]
MSAALQKRAPSEPSGRYHVQALWDAEVEVWVAASGDAPGLVAEAATIEALLDDIRAIVPELNAVPHPARIQVSLTAERSEAIEPV